MSLTELVPPLQLSIGPVILTSGIGLLLLTMTNRLGRVIDRARLLAHDVRRAPDVDQDNTRAQLKILAHRARIVRAAIALAALSVFWRRFSSSAFLLSLCFSSRAQVS